ncbi:MAG: hypothetical protein IPN76_08655 [Saprospiraceae bacterium]|nr:hypothetical protein [Saprospiraceae bacterium]
MKNKPATKLLAYLMLTLGCHTLWCSNGNPDSLSLLLKASQFTVNTDQIVAPIQPTMYGIFFEDINFGADGGLYAELVKNRTFEFDDRMMGWEQPASNRFSMNDQAGLYASATLDEKTKDLVFKIVNATAFEQPISINLTGIKTVGKTGTLTMLKSKDRNAVNAFENPNKILPTSKDVSFTGKDIGLSVLPKSVNVLRVLYK